MAFQDLLKALPLISPQVTILSNKLERFLQAG